MDLHGGGIDTRGASAPGFPGYMLIGRGQDFAWSLTSAGNDMIDEYVETLCGERHPLPLQGPLPPAWAPSTRARSRAGKVSFRTTVHGPVTGYATVGGKRVAITEKRASRGRDVLWQLLFQDLSHEPAAERPAVPAHPPRRRRSPSTWPTRTTATSRCSPPGRLPLRAPGVDPSLPTDGRGGYEWRGFLPARRHPQVDQPEERRAGQLEQQAGPQTSRPPTTSGATARSTARTCSRPGSRKRRRHTLASVVSAMNAGGHERLPGGPRLAGGGRGAPQGRAQARRAPARAACTSC